MHQHMLKHPLKSTYSISCNYISLILVCSASLGESFLLRIHKAISPHLRELKLGEVIEFI